MTSEIKAIKTSTKHIGEFIGFKEERGGILIEIRFNKKNELYSFLNKGVAKEFLELGMEYFDELHFLATKRSKIITHYIRHFPAKQQKLF